MKKSIFIIVLCGTIMSLSAQSNKRIFLNNSEQIKYSRIKGNKINVKYKTPEGSKKSLNYEDIYFVIKRKTVLVPGKVNKMKYLKPGPLTMDIKDINPKEGQTRGMVDAISNSNFMGARIGGMLTGLLIPIGLVGSAVIASTPPADHKLIPPDNAYANDKLYLESYQKTVKKIKKKETWLGSSFGASLALTISAAIMGASF